MPVTLKSQRIKINTFVPDSDRYSIYSQELANRHEENRLRKLVPIDSRDSRTTVEIDGKRYLNFCSNDYLGLAGHPEVIRRSVDYTRKYGTGSSASRLISGSCEYHHRLEEKIARLYQREAALLLGSGFQANISLLPALAGRGDLLLADKQCHNSLIQGGLLSRADFRRFRHNDPDHLESLLRKASAKNFRSVWVITESLFSMDGDFALLEEITDLCKKYGSFLYVDEAHAFGVWGEKGMGICIDRPEVDVILGTLGKSAGSYGAYISTSDILKKYTINYCSGFIYTTSPPPAIVGSADAAFDLIPGMDEERNVLKNLISYTTESLHGIGFDTGESQSQIIPVIMDNELQALELAKKLYNHNIYVQAVRPPTVDTSRLRITLSTAHTELHVNKLLDVLENG